ncbi:hypothetical protein H5410_025070 [Solanum commersonii]|uniref:Uncharacterized protein n=1 Tax=Solanum commersonii TaxID=4109 RepID=A0A9J5YT70_SOLCO|nr:hypothetical protein H5410_025070 [Solanum commersonii]
MSNCSSTLFMLLLLLVASGSMVVASNPKDTCMTYLGPSASTNPCGADCCRDKCLEQFKDKKPNPFYEEVPGGDPTHNCRCYHACP